MRQCEPDVATLGIMATVIVIALLIRAIVLYQ